MIRGHKSVPKKTSQKERYQKMKKIAWMFLAIVILAGFSFGCAGMTKKETKVRCPRCGATFTIEEEMHMRDITQ
jgi:hypothetical protein